jgi:nanoRNase/pAp phosphatase (c-di-AMP/oligoRNAs hydrolase)
MALKPEQQAIDLLSRATRILIATPEHPDPDTVSGAVAVSLLLNKLKKTHDMVVPGVDTQPLPSFLPRVEARPKIGAVRAFHLEVDVKQSPLSELMYDVQGDTLTVTLIPANGEWSPKDVSFRHGADRYDLVVAVGASDMASLGDLFRDHADFLYRTPIINIGHQPTNEHWGQINLVDLNAVSTTEVLARWIEGWNPDMLDADLATALLAGMISQTQSFRTPNVTPLTLQASSRLMERGARREEIVHALWRTTPVAELKLWGRALSRLEHDKETGLVWTVLGASDSLETGGGSLDGMVRELVTYAPEAKVIAIMSEERGRLQIELHAKAPHSAAEIARAFGASGTRERASFITGSEGTFVEQARTVADKIRELLRTLR